MQKTFLKWCLLEYSDHYSKISESLWQYSRDEPNKKWEDSDSFELKLKLNNNNAKGNSDTETTVSLKYFSRGREGFGKKTGTVSVGTEGKYLRL